MKQITTHTAQLVILIQILGVVVAPGVFAQNTSTSPNPSIAQSATSENYTLLEPLPCVKGNGVDCQEGKQIEQVNFSDYVRYLFNLLIAIAAVSAVFMIVWGGLQYMTSDSWSDKKGGREKATNAVLGLLLVLCSWLILRTIDPRLVEVPETFVPPLADCKVNPGNVLCKRSGTSDLYDKLNKDMTRIEAEATSQQQRESAQQAHTQIQQSQTQAQKAQEDVDRLNRQQQLINNGTITSTNAIENSVELQRAQAELAQVQAEAVSTGAVEEMKKYNWQSDGSVLDTQSLIDVQRSEVERLYAEAQAQLQTLSNPADPDSMQKLKAAYLESINYLDERQSRLTTH